MPLLTQSFASTALSSGSYDTNTQELEITFVNGGTYTFENVPEHIWDGLVTARSPGGYYTQNIKGRY